MNTRLPFILTMALSIGIPLISLADDHVVTLNMDWQAARVSQHHRVIDISNSDSTISVRYLMEGRYRQKITEHNEGLLVSRYDVSIDQSSITFTEIKPSELQRLIMNVTALMMISTPDYIVSPDGQFLRIDDFDAFKTIQTERLISLTSVKEAQLQGPLQSVYTVLLNLKSYENTLKSDMSYWTEWHGKTLTQGEPLAGVSSVTATQPGSESRAVESVDGEFSYHGPTPCESKKNTGLCADLRFHAEIDSEAGEGLTFDIQFIAKPDTLVPYHYVAQGSYGKAGKVRIEHRITDLD